MIGRRMKTNFQYIFFILTLSICLLIPSYLFAQSETLKIPHIETEIVIDGNLSEWRDFAFTDGLWDIYRAMQSPWYEPAKNRLTDHGSEPLPEDDLNARYYIGWDERFLYLGAEVSDNINDVSESKHAPKRWYYKDAIAWFFEAPADTISDTFGEGNHAFAFVMDTTYPEYGAWWRHGNKDTNFLEEALPEETVAYAIRFVTGRNKAGYDLEARIDLNRTFSASTSSWETAESGKFIRMMIVHCDPDGGEYGGHLLIYGKGDADESWKVFQLGGPAEGVRREQK